MATISNFRLAPDRDPDMGSTVEIEALPFPAALLDSDAVFVAVNSEWLACYPEAGCGESCLSWCESTHGSDAAFRSELLSGIRTVLANTQERFTRDYAEAGVRRRVSISRCSRGVLVIEYELAAAPEAANGYTGSGRQSQKMETVGRLVGGVAHDFANLLTLISGYADILVNRVGETSTLNPELYEIRQAASRGARLTAQLLGYTRGRPVEPRPVDLNSIIGDMQRMLRPIIGEYVSLETSLSANLGRVLADPGQMEQVIMNLILNARDAMPGGGRIRIETANGDLDQEAAQAFGMPPGPCVMLTISDTGHGIEPELLPHIFEPFFTTKQEGRGTGLGLSTVHSIAKQSGGDVWVRSTPNQGSSFTLCLPCAAHDVETAGSPSVAHSAAPGNETILLVEDEDAVRKLLTHVLRKRGYSVLEAANAEDALRFFDGSGDEIRLVLTDMVMPRMSGRELAEQILRIRPDMKVIFMSGYTDDVLVRTGALGPGMSFLQKPLRPDVLAGKIREALDSPSRPFNPR